MSMIPRFSYTECPNVALANRVSLLELCSISEDVHLKLLIPCVAAGAIIGKGGEGVEAIKRQAGARLKMSQADDFYPGSSWPSSLHTNTLFVGTTERVCLIVGTIDACMQLHDYIMEKIGDKPELVNNHNHIGSSTATTTTTSRLGVATAVPAGVSPPIVAAASLQPERHKQVGVLPVFIIKLSVTDKASRSEQYGGDYNWQMWLVYQANKGDQWCICSSLATVARTEATGALYCDHR